MNLRKSIVAIAAAALVLAGSATATLAATTDTNTATVTIIATTDVLAVTVSSASFGSHPYNLAPQTVTGNLKITAYDNRGTGAGWRVNLRASNFSSLSTVSTIPVGNLSLIAGTIAPVGTVFGLEGVTKSDASPVNATGTQVLRADLGAGMGTFELPMSASLLVPGGTLVGTYTSTVTVDIVSGP